MPIDSHDSSTLAPSPMAFLESTSMQIVMPIVAGIGNALLAVPLARALKQLLPHSRLCVIARIAAMAEPFRRLSEVDEVLVSGTGVKGQLRTLLWTRLRRPGLYVVPFPSNRWQYNALAIASGASMKLMHRYPAAHRARLSRLVGTRVEAIRGLHDVEQNLRLLVPLGREDQAASAPTFPVAQAESLRAVELLHESGVDRGESFVVMHAGSARTVLAKAKRWPPARYAKLAEQIHESLRLPVVIVEGPDERGVASQIASHLHAHARVCVLPLHGSLGESAAVLEKAVLYVGTDSGLAHLAAAVGTPPVTLFAPADPDRVCPFGFRHLVVQPACGCCPCMSYPWTATRPGVRCTPPLCIEQITVDQVMKTVLLAAGETRA